MVKEYITKSAEETIAIGVKIGKLLQISDVVLLTGDLSAGKTTLTKGIGSALQVTKVINSPTFTIVKEYKGLYPLYHLDLYRLNGLNQDFDLEEFIGGDGVCVIEWPNQVEELLPKEFLEVSLERINEFERKIVIFSKGKHYEEVVMKL